VLQIADKDSGLRKPEIDTQAEEFCEAHNSTLTGIEKTQREGKAG